MRDGVVRAQADIISMSRRMAVVRIDVTNNDRLCAAAQGTVSIQDPEVGAGDPGLVSDPRPDRRTR